MSFDRDIERKVRGRSEFTPRKRAAEAAGISEGSLASYRAIIDNAEPDIINKLKADKLTISAAYAAMKSRMEGKDQQESSSPSPLRVVRIAGDLKDAIGTIKSIPQLSDRLISLVDTASKCNSADRKKLKKLIEAGKMELIKAKTDDTPGKLLEALTQFEAGLA